jgi:uncharacterized membrane protein
LNPSLLSPRFTLAKASAKSASYANALEAPAPAHDSTAGYDVKGPTMRWYIWLLLSPVILLVVLTVAAWIAYKLSPEGREDAAVRRRMEAQGRKARRQLYDEQFERTREQIRREQDN